MSYTVNDYHVHFTREALEQFATSLEALDDDDLHFRLHETSNSIAWDAWHVFRTVDNLVHFVFEREAPVWIQHGLWEQWGLPRVDQGTSMPPDEAFALRFPPGPELARYGRDVLDAVLPRIERMDADYLQVVQRVIPWGDVTRHFVLGKIVTHSNKHLGYAAAAIGVRGKQAPSF